MKKLNVGVIGTGRIGKVHAANLAYQIPQARLVAVSDTQATVAKTLAQDLHVAKTYENYQDLLKDPEVQAVAICSSTDTHAQITEEAARAGKHIFCEKPVDLSIAKIESALAVVAKAGVVLQVGFNRRFDPSFRRVAELVKSGKIGKPHLVRITSRDPSPPNPAYVKVSGGMFLDMTIHDFDMARYLINDEVDEVYAAGAVLVDPEIGKQGDIDTAVVTLRYKGGAIGTIDNSRKAVYGYDQRAEVFGSAGCAISANHGPNQTTLWSGEGLRQDLPLHFFIERYAEAFRVEMHEFVQNVLEGKTPSVGGNDGLQSARIALAAKKSLAERRAVKVSEIS